MKSKFRCSIASVLIVSVFSMGLPVPAQAGIVGTEAAADRERIAAVLDREEVRTRLAAYGVDPTEAKARVAALTDEEAIRLATEMDTLPAGGNAVAGLFAFLGFVVYLVVWVVCSAIQGKACK
jgi:hypothetical protein